MHPRRHTATTSAERGPMDDTLVMIRESYATMEVVRGVASGRMDAPRDKPEDDGAVRGPDEYRAWTRR
jgi:hypothetical protein